MPFKALRDKLMYMKKYNKKTVDQRVKRNKARREAIRRGQARTGDGTHVDHEAPLSKGGGNGEGNTRVVDATTNLKKYNKRKKKNE